MSLSINAEPLNLESKLNPDNNQLRAINQEQNTAPAELIKKEENPYPYFIDEEKNKTREAESQTQMKNIDYNETYEEGKQTKNLINSTSILISIIGYEQQTIQNIIRLQIPYSNRVKKDLISFSKKYNIKELEELSEVYEELIGVTPMQSYIMGILKQNNLEELIKPSEEERKAARLMNGNKNLSKSEEEIRARIMSSKEYQAYFPFRDAEGLSASMVMASMKHPEIISNTYGLSIENSHIEEAMIDPYKLMTPAANMPRIKI